MLHICMFVNAAPPRFAQADHKDAFSGPTKEILLKIQEKSTSFSYTSRDALSVLRPGLKMVTLAPPPHFAQADHRDAFSSPTKEILLKIQEKSTSFSSTFLGMLFPFSGQV